ncbi:MAG: 16S rRNA (guanine(527)-N(7))-methyltransferase RsmG [Elusimicrobiaceae bacterium]|nr:16S rRNA (guanine(527)-N(7))-methyltransferase RsmG [Elusimicrobiaceae bacterium]
MDKREAYLKTLDLKLSPKQEQNLLAYIDLLWQKKSDLNLTSVQTKQEIWDRHILDALNAVSLIKKINKTALNIADFGSGAGYIGLVIAIMCSKAKITLVESLNKRCLFLNWICLKLGLNNVEVLNIKAGQKDIDKIFDITTERAMGKIDDILPLCTKNLKHEGHFFAYQGVESVPSSQVMQTTEVCLELEKKYFLPCDEKMRKIAVFRKV